MKNRMVPRCILYAAVATLVLIAVWGVTAARLSTTTICKAVEVDSTVAFKLTSPSSAVPIVLDAGSNFRLEALPKPIPATGVASPFAPPSSNLDQIRNGSAASPVSPGNWVNGNAGSSQAHYAEGYSIPYRNVMTDLPTGTPITLTLGYDIKHSDHNAIDYLTHFDRIDDPAGSHLLTFGHGPETINPTLGVSGLSATTTTFPIPVPDTTNSPAPGQPATSFNALPAGDRVMTLFGGTITNVAYVTEGDLTAGQAETQIAVTFTVNSATAVLAWGGHIASRFDWGFVNGEPRSAGGISGSPYHMRLISWTLGNLGNQDRSLSAAAVFVPCASCSVNGVASTVCPGSTNTHTSTINTDGVCGSPQHSWSFVSNTSGASFVGSTTGASVVVNAGSSCNGSYTIKDTVTCTGCTGVTTITCTKTVNVVDNTPPVITCPTNKTVECGGSTLPAATGMATATDGCSTPTVTYTDSFTPGCGNTGVINRTWKATDACGNMNTCVQTITIVDTTPPTISCPSNVTVQCLADVPAAATTLTGFMAQGGSASDTCGSVTISSTDMTTPGPCGAACGGRIVRTYKATDACGNMNTCTQIITYGIPPTSLLAQNMKELYTKLLSLGDLIVGEPGARSLTIPGGSSAKSSALCLLSRLPTDGSANALADFGDRTLDPVACQTSPPLELQEDGAWRSVLLGQAVSLALNLRLDAQQPQRLKGQVVAAAPNLRPDAHFELSSFVLTAEFWTQRASPGLDGVTGTDDDELDPSSARMQFTIPASVLKALGPDAKVPDLLRLANAALAGLPTGDVSVSDITAALDAINRSYDFGKRRVLNISPKPTR